MTLRTLGTNVTALNNAYASKKYLPVRGVGADLRVVTIMVYHSIPVLATFQTDCDYYQEWNYTTITPDDISNFKAGTGTLPAKPLILSFDDGLPTQYAAGQELNTRGMKGVFFIATGWIDGTVTQAGAGFAEATPLTWTQINQLKAWGHDIQSHTVSHTDMTTLTGAQAASEYTTSKARIEAQVAGQSVNHIAYPYGACTATTRSALSGAGCKTGRLVRVDTTTWAAPPANQGRYSLANTAMDPLLLPSAGTAYTDVFPANTHRLIAPDEDLIADYGFEAGAKGWSLGTGFASATDDKHSGTKSLKCTQGTSTVSSSVFRPVPIGPYARIAITGWIRTTLPTGNYGKIQVQILKADGTTIVATTDVGQVTGTAAWTQVSLNFTGTMGDYYLKMFCAVAGNASPSGAAWFDDISVVRDPVGSIFGKPF